MPSGPILEPGLMDSVLDPCNEFSCYVMRYRVSIYMALINYITLAIVAAKVYSPVVRKRFPMNVPVSKKEVMHLVAINIVCTLIYATNITTTNPRFEENWMVANRMKIILGAHAVFTAAYYLIQKYVFFSLVPEHRPAQAANLIRVIVKLSAFVFWALTGEFFTVVTKHPLELDDNVYMKTHYVVYAINALYLWEVMFRDLKPVNVIHHAIACMGFSSFSEWANVLEPARTNTLLPILGSLIEGFCCVGSMCYRLLPRGKLLQRIMLSVTFFVLISYNILMVGYVVLLYAYNDLYGFGYGKVCMPCLALFTYPAQMNMAKMYWSLSKKSAPLPVPEKAVEESKVTDLRRRRA